MVAVLKRWPWLFGRVHVVVEMVGAVDVFASWLKHPSQFCCEQMSGEWSWLGDDMSTSCLL